VQSFGEEAAMEEARRTRAIELLTQFAERTGVTGERPPERYLWTDAFAVCTFLGLGRSTGEARFKEIALSLIDQVHRTLGRHRADDARKGWLSGIDEREGEAHPTRGGLRIGKKLPERAAGEPLDEELEWDRDGQYFHYITKWMHALDQAARSAGRPEFNRWARELAEAAHRAFTFEPRGGGKRMFWKMSIDLSRPLVASMGQHDPLDGFITCAELEATAAVLPDSAGGPHVADQAADFAAMIDPRNLATADPLGLGGLLMDADRVDQLTQREVLGTSGDALLDSLLTAAVVGLTHYARLGDLRRPADRRLAFRELGLSIGLAAASALSERAQTNSKRFSAGSDLHTLLKELGRCAPLRAEIEAFWLRPENRGTALWLEHRNINDVMLATSLEPEGFLTLAAP
jgi:hypothetical protein